jgi:hypothetical protein
LWKLNIEFGATLQVVSESQHMCYFGAAKYLLQGPKSLFERHWFVKAKKDMLTANPVTYRG